MMKSIVTLVLGFLGFCYLINPTAGVFELLPDNLPFLGNLDEAVAAGLVLTALRYFGIDLTKGFGSRSRDVSSRK